MKKLLLCFRATRPHFLVHSLFLSLLAVALASVSGPVNGLHALLCVCGTLLLHASTNVLNDYFDHRSGIDARTDRTPFSGGSGLIRDGILTERATLILGLLPFALALPIGAYFVFFTDWRLLFLFLFGSAIVLFGTSKITRWGFGLGELSAGLGLGVLPILGIYWILKGSVDARALFGSLPSGLLAFNLLLLNEFADVEADKAGGRRTLAIMHGKKGAASLYALLTGLVYVWILAGVVSGRMPFLCLLGLLTLPFAQKAMRGAVLHEEQKQLVKAMAANVVVVLGTQALLALGYFLG
ncbi:MAG: prenyltransferase [Fibrobacterota bacterium]